LTVFNTVLKLYYFSTPSRNQSDYSVLQRVSRCTAMCPFSLEMSVEPNIQQLFRTRPQGYSRNGSVALLLVVVTCESANTILTEKRKPTLPMEASVYSTVSYGCGCGYSCGCALRARSSENPHHRSSCFISLAHIFGLINHTTLEPRLVIKYLNACRSPAISRHVGSAMAGMLLQSDISFVGYVYVSFVLRR